MKKHLFSAWKKILLLTIGSFFASNLIVAAEIDMEGPGSTVKITNTQGTVIDEPAGVTIRDSEQTIQKSNATIKQQNVKGGTEETRPDGTRIIKNNDGSSVQTNPDGSQTIINNDGSSIQKNADGTQIIKNASGEIIK